MQRRGVRFAVMAAFVVVAASAEAQDWGNIAIISSTLGNHAGRICVGEGLRVTDIGCPSYAPSLTTAGDVSVTGNLSANKFIGDGSLLTGIGQDDRIISGTANIIAWQDHSLTFTTAGAQRMVVGENGFIGVGHDMPSEPLHVGGFSGGGSIAGGRIFVGEVGPERRGLLIAAGQGELSSATYPPYIRIHGYNYGSTTAVPIAINPYGNNGGVAIGRRTPLATLDVNGTISASDAIQVGTSSLACSAGVPGAIRYSSGNMQFCNGSAWTTLGNAGAATAASSTGAIQFNSANVLAGDTANLFWDDANNRLGIGTDAPGASLDVSGGGVIIGRNSSTGANEPYLMFKNTTTGDVMGMIRGVSSTGMRFTGASTANEFARFSPSGYFGIGTLTPSATLTVSGSAIISGTIQVAGAANETCTAGKLGTLRFNPVTGAPQICVQR